jgi:hypothetical protein
VGKPPATGAVASADRAALGAFIALSVGLTGFERVRLVGTGMAHEYLRVVGSALPAGVLDDLLAAAGTAADAANVGVILRDPKLGPVARNLTILWYCGTWAPLPEAWQQAYGTVAAGPSGVVSAQAYQQGLQWVAAGAHPMGARQQGYGAWAQPPSEVAR